MVDEETSSTPALTSRNFDRFLDDWQLLVGNISHVVTSVTDISVIIVPNIFKDRLIRPHSNHFVIVLPSRWWWKHSLIMSVNEGETWLNRVWLDSGLHLFRCGICYRERPTLQSPSPKTRVAWAHKNPNNLSYLLFIPWTRGQTPLYPPSLALVPTHRKCNIRTLVVWGWCGLILRVVVWDYD